MLLFPSSTTLSRFPSPLTGISAGLGSVPVRGTVIQILALEGTDSLVTMFFPGHDCIHLQLHLGSKAPNLSVDHPSSTRGLPWPRIVAAGPSPSPDDKGSSGYTHCCAVTDFLLPVHIHHVKTRKVDFKCRTFKTMAKHCVHYAMTL